MIKEIRHLGKKFILLLTFSLFFGCSTFQGIWNLSCKDCIIIYCPENKKPLYKFYGKLEHKQPIYAKDFKPIGRIKAPTEYDDMVCPICASPLNGYKYWFWKRRRSTPKMAFQVTTLMVKENNKFIWKPYKVDLKD